MPIKPTYKELEQQVQKLKKDNFRLKKAEDALEESEAFLNQSQEIACIGSYATDLKTGIWRISKQMYSILGIDKSYPHTLEGFIALVHPDSVEDFLAYHHKVESGQLPFDYEYKIIRINDKAVRWVHGLGVIEYDDHLNPIRRVGTIQDITDRKQAKEKLRVERDLIQNFMEISPAGITHVDKHGKIIYANPRAQKILGILSDKIETRLYNDPEWEITDIDGGLLPEEKLPFNLVKQTGKPAYGIQHAIKWPDGRQILLSINSSPLINEEGEFDGMIATLDDITEKHGTEKKYEMLFNEMIDGFALHEIICDDQKNPIDYRFLDINPAFERMTGLKRDTLIGKTVLEVLPETEPYWIEKYGRVALSGKHDSFESYSKEFDRHFQVTAFKPADNQFACIFIDITQRKKAEEAVQKSEEQFRHFFDHLTIGVAVYEAVEDGQDFVFKDMNPAGQKLSKVSIEEIRGRKLSQIFPGAQDLGLLAALQETWRTGKPNQIPLKEYNDTRITQWVENRIFQIPSGKLITVYDDRTELLRLEEGMRQAQKMESIGNLAGGIAHDFNNILSPIVGLSEMLIDDLPSDSPEHEMAVEIHRAGNRGSDLVKQILTFSRQSEQKKIPLRIQNVLKEVMKLSRSSIPSDITITHDIQGDCRFVQADPTRIHQIAMNLITNAYHAVESESGEIVVRLKEVEIGYGQLTGKDLLPGRYAVLSVSDTGVGIDPAIKDKIFEPYFTTKARGKGTGLGLAVTFGIVKEYGGDIKVSSELGKGTTFSVYLPIMAESEKLSMVAGQDAHPTGTEHILLIDDEKAVAMFEKLMLERLGYKVSVHINSLEALEAFKTNPGLFDLVICDMTMPNMTGDRLAREMMAVRPRIPIIIYTGFSSRLDKKKAAAIGIKGLLMKPVASLEMAKTVRKVLDEAQRADQLI